MTWEDRTNRYCMMAMPLLFFLIILSLFAIVFSKDLNRRKFIQYQTLLQAETQLQLDWNKILLEQSTLTTQSRVQKIAEQQLGMIAPTTRQLLFIPREKSND
ncbi:MAG: cell division protein FtsL [Gammaproteobacteria bacterium RIFCSPHIGHO2_12_FULL_41_15]|nr:MAG: cell division protein FtsL [Gammaproteobacteria bacterium RIFCSPHIGHO2_12_FULL_41_15]